MEGEEGQTGHTLSTQYVFKMHSFNYFENSLLKLILQLHNQNLTEGGNIE